jgi:hypothetical protein
MAEIVTVQLFPPQPVGVRAAQTNPMSREAVLVPIPCYEYQNATDVSTGAWNGITFTTRQGDRIESNLPYLVRRESKSEGDA